MTDTEAPTATAGPPVSVDAQDPLPESNWFWRRLFIFGLTAIVIVGVWYFMVPIRSAAMTGNKDAILGTFDIVSYLLGLILVNTIFYTIAPSGEQVAKMFNLSTILSRGAGWMTTSTASNTEGGQAKTTTTVTGAPQSASTPPSSLPQPPQQPRGPAMPEPV